MSRNIQQTNSGTFLSQQIRTI